MGLTRIRAEQISDIDYKQAVRVITLSNVTLSGGAPAEVDGVSLVTSDRVLVNGQSNAAQNGLYQVQTVGAGSNGTWVRTSDGNQDGEIQPGMVVMVTQGTVYADTPWKLITNGEIIIGTTELTFTENYSLAFGNIFANGTAVIANVVSAPVTFAAGDNISITGNNVTKTVTISATGGGGGSGTAIVNGTSNVDIATADANITMAVDGVSNVVVVTTEGLGVTGNITGNYFIGNGSQLTGIATSAFDLIQVSGQSNVDAATSTTLTLVAGDGISITTDAGNTTITFTNTSVESIFATGGDMGLVTQAPTDEEDLGLITVVFTESYDLGSVVQQFAIAGNLAGNLIGNTHSIVDLATLEVLGNVTAGNLTPVNALEITYGGTGATDAANALSNLGAASVGKAIAMTIVFG